MSRKNCFLCAGLLFGLIFSFGYSVAMANEASKKSPSEKVIMDYLQEDGYSPKIDEDNDIAFKYEGLNYFVRLDAEDETFYRILLLGIDEVDTDDASAFLSTIMAAHEATKSVKVAKVIVSTTGNKGKVHVVIEIFCHTPEAFTKVLKRGVSCCRVAAKSFYETKKKLTEDSSEKSD